MREGEQASADSRQEAGAAPHGPDGSAASQPARWSRWERIACAIFAVLVLASLPAQLHPWSSGTQDASMYVLTARSLAAGEGYTFLGEPFTVRPPGLSFLLAPIVALRGLDWRALHIVVSLFGAAAVLLLAAFQRPRLGTGLALAVALSVWLLPSFQLLGNQTLTDLPGVALLLLALLVERWSARRPGIRREVALGLVLGAAGYVRTAVLLLIPAIWLSRILLAPRGGAGAPAIASFALRRLLLFAVVAGACLIPWSMRNARARTGEPVDQVALYSFSTWLLHEDAGDPGSPRFGPEHYRQRIPRRAGELLGVLGQRDAYHRSGGPRTIEVRSLVVAVVLLLGAAWVAVKRREPAELFVFAYAGFLCLFRSHLLARYALPIYVVALPATVELGLDLMRSLPRRVPARGLAAAAVLLLAGWDFGPWEGRAEIEEFHTMQVARADALRSVLGPNEIAGAEFGWHLSLFLDRPVYSFRRAIKRFGVEAGTDFVIEEYGLRTIILMPDCPDREFVEHVLQKYGQRGARRAGDALLVRVRRRAAGARPERD